MTVMVDVPEISQNSSSNVSVKRSCTFSMGAEAAAGAAGATDRTKTGRMAPRTRNRSIGEFSLPELATARYVGRKVLSRGPGPERRPGCGLHDCDWDLTSTLGLPHMATSTARSVR